MTKNARQGNLSLRITLGFFALIAIIFLGGQVISIIFLGGQAINILYFSSGVEFYFSMSFPYFWLFANLLGVVSMLLLAICLFAFYKKNKTSILGVSILLLMGMQIFNAVRFAGSIITNYTVIGYIDNKMIATLAQ
jgi:hypothetical protein